MNKLILSILMGVIFCGQSYARQEVVPETKDTFADVPAQIKAAKWIWPDPAHWYDIVNCYALFRHPFDLNEVPKEAKIYITADQNYKLYINGEYVGRGPARGHQESYSYDIIDVAKYLKTGKNLIAVRAYNGGKSTFSYVHQSSAGLLYTLDLGNGKYVSSHPKVSCMREDSIDRNAAQAGMQLNYQEHVDMRKVQSDWIQIDFDDSSWSGTEGKNSARVYNAMPYYNLEPRGTPMQEEYLLSAPKLIAKGKGKAANSDEKVKNINQLFESEPVKHIPAEGVAENMAIEVSADGEYNTYILDYGHTVIGMPILEIKGAKGGEIIDMMTSETLFDDLSLKNDYRQHSKPAVSNRMIAREGDQSYEYFSPYGFRYVEVRVRKNKNPEMKLTFNLRWSAYPLGDKGKFKSSDDVLNDIWKISVHTQRVCALDGYVDTPHREQAQWWGDARVQCWNTFFISGDARLLRRGIHIISQQSLKNGLTYGHAPTMAHNCILPDFSIVWMLTLWDHYWQTGDAEAYKAHKKTIDGLLAYFDSAKSDNGLLAYDDRYWLFLDWCGIQKQGNPAIYNLWYLYALDKLSELCKREGMDKDSAEYAARAKQMRQAITKNLLDSEGFVHDGILPDGKLNPSTSIQAQTLAKLCNIEGFDFQKALDKILLPFVRSERAMAEMKPDEKIEGTDVVRNMMPSSYWVIYSLQVLDDAGYHKEVVDFYKRNWAVMIPYGGTYESYEGRASLSHAWTAHPAFMLPRILGGVRQEAPAWKKISFKPTYIGDSAEVLYPTPQGDIKVQWKKDANGNIEEKLDLPQGVKL